MFFRHSTGRACVVALGLCCLGMGAHAAPQVALADGAQRLPMVPAAGPGIFTAQKKADNRYRLVVTGHKFIGRDAVEKYLAWRAADLALEQDARWFRFTETRVKGDTAALPKRDPAGPRYSFRMEYFRPAWRYKTAGDAAWKSWSPFSGAAFFADGKDAATITEFEASAEITLHKDQMDDADPLAFEAGALSDLLVNQVSPPQ
jgi:hypothetical protein